MTKIAHLTDLHLLEDDHESRQGISWLRLNYLSFGRPAHAGRRRVRAIHALQRARFCGADHLVLTGDLTEDGHDAQFEVLADVLRQGGWPASRVTMVPGNHDAYTDPAGWDRALAGPLRAYAATSAPGAAVVLGDATIVALSTAVPQHFTRSAGWLESAQLDLARRVARETRRTGRALILAQHHPPEAYRLAAYQWIDGLQTHAELMVFLRENDGAHVLHGHAHALADRPALPGGSRRIFCANAVVDSDAPLRVYRAVHGRLWPEEPADGDPERSLFAA